MFVAALVLAFVLWLIYRANKSKSQLFEAFGAVLAGLLTVGAIVLATMLLKVR